LAGAGGVSGFFGNGSLLIDEVHSLSTTMTRAPQYLKLWLQHKAAHGVYLQVQVTALVTGAAPVHVHLAAGLHPVIDLVIVQAVGANQGVASSQHHTALQLHSQIRTAPSTQLASKFQLLSRAGTKR
jgi:hypothetical protein